jgi:PAS domain S-box-containing protein
MFQLSKKASESSSIRRYMIAAAVVWTLYIGATVMFALLQAQWVMTELAVSQARVSFEKDVLYRHWVAGHGGVYVPATAETPPSPYLSQIPERDITTPSGRRLTLINASYMTRQVQGQGREAFGDREHIASLKPINPVNIPDPWEAGALIAFEKGTREIYATATMEGKPYLRFMRPLVTEKSCLKCHAAQGYKEGDIRGGISISLPLDELIAMTDRNKRIMSVSLGLLWLLGLCGIGVVSRTISKRFEKQKKSEASLQETEERFRTIIEQSADGVILIDEQGSIIEWNHAQEQLTGLPREQVLGKPFWEVQLQLSVPQMGTVEQYDHLRRIILDAIASGTSPYFCRVLQGVVQQKDGTQKIIQETFFPITTGCGVRLGSIIRDVTEQKQAEVALKQSEERLRSFMEQANEAIFICDTNGAILFWNRKAEEIYGYTVDEILGKPYSTIVPQRFNGVHQKWMKLFLSADESSVSGKIVEGIGEHKDGHEFNLETSTAILRQGSEKLAVVITRNITERKQAEQELREAKEFLENVFQTSGDGLIVTDEQGYIKKPNDKALKIFGYSEQELTGMHFAELSPVNHTDNTYPSVIEQLIEKGVIENREAEYHRKDGTIFPVETNMRSMKDKEGTLIGAIASVRDITERKISDERLREAKEQLEKFLENSIDPILVGDSTGHIVKPNKAFLDMLGYAADEIIGSSAHGLSVTEPGVYESTVGETVTITEDIFRENYSCIEQLFDKGKSSNWETYYIHKSGKIIPVTQNIILTYNDQGGVTGSFSIIRDLTSAKRAEVELRVSEERFRAIAESSIDAIVTADTNGKITFCNPAAEKMFGYSREELIGQPGSMLVAERFRAQDRTAYQDILQKNTQHLVGKPVEACGLKKDRKEFPVEISITTYTIDDKLYFTSTIHDISERIRFEEQIRQSQKMEAIGTLAGGIAHDFNNILAAIIGFTEMSVQKLEQDTSLKRNMEQVLKSSYRARDLIKQILTFSRKNFEDRKPIEISPIIREALKMLRASIPTTIDIQVNIDSRAGMINADPTQMHQVLMNLCTNAAHAMRDTGGVLDISLCPVFLDARKASSYQGLAPGAYLRLTVHDTGAGIAPAVIDRIFEPFFTTKEVGQGSGMGLAVVHGIVKSHGGAIAVDSKPGSGTAFHIMLPQVEDTKEEVPDSLPIVPKGCESILYVDDEAALVELGQEMLESLGYRVTAKKNSVEALEKFKTDPHGFDILITDQTMPAMTGFDLAKQVMDIRPDIPVILCTGHSDKVTKEMARDAGIREFVMKPMTIQTLAETVRSALNSQPA